MAISATNLKKELKQAPIQIVIPSNHPIHAVTLVYVEGTKAYYFDHYTPFLKTIEVSSISSALKIVLNNKYMNDLVKNIIINGTHYVGIASRNLDAARAVSKAFGKEIQVSPTGQILNADFDLHT